MFKLFRRKRTEIVKAAVQTLDKYPYSHDVPFLESVHPWLVFIYDDLQREHPRHYKLMDAGAWQPNPHRPFEAMYAYTLGSFVLWKHRAKQDSFAVALDNPPARFKNTPDYDLAGPSARKVKGQLYKIGWQGMAALDEHYRNGVEFKRRRVSLVVPYHYQLETDGRISVSMQNHAIIGAWMYVGIQDFWDKNLDGTYVPVRKLHRRYTDPEVPVFYLFTKIEYGE